jgi:spermidine synthase
MSSFRTKILTIFFFSGISGLIYEIIWSRILAQIFGSSIYAITIILSIFMAGLAAGSFIFGKIIDKNRKIPNLKFYALLELGIAISASFSLLLLPLIKNIYIFFYNSLGNESIILNLVRFFSAACILIIPAILMGGTLPVLLKSIVKDEKTSAIDVGIFYGINTLGAAAGVILSAFYFIENVGVHETFFIAVLINLSISIIIFFFYKNFENDLIKLNKSSGTAKSVTEPTKKSGYKDKTDKKNPVSTDKKVTDKDIAQAYFPKSKSFLYVLIISYGFSGLISLALETLWTRSLIFFIGSSTYAFSIILINFLLGIAIGSFLMTLFIKKINNSILTCAILEILLAITSLLSILLFHRYSNENLNISLTADPLFLGSLNSGFSLIFLKTFYIVFPSTLIMGMLFPLVNQIYNRTFRNFGANIGKIYSSNTIGTIFGSLLAAFVFIPVFGVSLSIALFSIINIIIGLVIFHYTNPSKIKLLFFYPIPFLFIISLFFLPYLKEFKSDTERSGDKTLYYKEDISATVKIYQDEEGFKSMSVNGMMIGGTQMKTMRKQVLLAHLPMLFHPKPEKVLTVGLGTGITLNELSLYHPKRLDCVEIVDAVKVGSHYFNETNENIIKKDNTAIHIEDGRNFLLTSNEEYDVIIDDSMLRRESAGNGPLYSDEYYQDCYKHLGKNGIFCQWLPLYLEKPTYQMVLRTLKKNFPYISLFYLGHAAVVQIATKEELKINIDLIKEKLNDSKIAHHLNLVEMDNIEAIIKSLLIDNSNLDKILGTGELNSDNNPLVEFRVPKEKGLEKTFSDNLLELAPYRPQSIPAIFNFSENSENTILKNRINKYWNSFHYILSGAIFTHAGDTKNGQLQYLKALEIDSTDKHALYFLCLSPNENKIFRTKSLYEIGNLYLGQKNIIKAINYYKQSLEVDSLFANGYNALANLYFNVGRINESIILGEKSIKIIPNNPILLFNLATYYEEAGNYKRACALYEESLKYDPTNKYAMEGRDECKKHL